MAVVARTRTRPAPPPAPKPEKLVFGHPVVGGPRDAMGAGFPIYTEGRTTPQWPYRTGSELIGYRLSEYQHVRSKGRLFHAGTDIVPVGTHAWQLRNGEFRYLGKFTSNDKALQQVEAAHARARSTSVPPVQPVAARPRVRITPK